MLNYIKREPKKKTIKPPLLILLHGYGSNEKDLFSFADELPDELLIISVQAPFNMGYDSYAWYAINFDYKNGKFSDLQQAKESILKIEMFINFIQKKYNTNTEKTFLLGFSQGAILSYAISLNYPNKVQYIIALSGYINEDLNPLQIDNSIETDYYISHGNADQVLPVEWARKSSNFLDKLKLKKVYYEYPIGHSINIQNFNNFKKWIQQRI